MVELYGGEKDLKISRTHRRGFKVDFHIVNLRGDVLRESVCSRGVSSTITVRDFELDAHLPVGARGMARAHHRSGRGISSRPLDLPSHPLISAGMAGNRG